MSAHLLIHDRLWARHNRSIVSVSTLQELFFVVVQRLAKEEFTSRCISFFNDAAVNLSFSFRVSASKRPRNRKEMRKRRQEELRQFQFSDHWLETAAGRY